MRCTVLCVAVALTAVCAIAGDAPLKRYPIPARCIQAESGHCYIAGMDFGEDGDKETGNKSGVLLFENGKPLGPPRAVHQDIRQQGQGRFSHWTRHGLYLSASDNTDPRGNGRKYEVASTNPENELAGLAEIPFTPGRHVEVIRGSHHEYSIRLGGNLDYENSHTRFNTGFTIAFQPNVALTIANTGDRPVAWPKLIANGTRDWSTYDSLLADFTRGATSDQERAWFIWQAARENRYHCSPLFPDNEFHDPVKIFNSYGLNLCDDMGYCGCSLFKHAGLGKPKYAIDPKVRCLNGHMMCEAVVDGRHQFIDIDESVFYLDRENQRPVSGDACARDHDLVRREVHYGPTFGGWDGSEGSAAIFGNDDRATQLFLRGHEMSYTLRPGERVVFRWDNIGKYAAHSKKWDQEPPYYGNSKFIYTPRIEEGAAAGTLVYAVDTPWAICGGTLRAEFTSVAQPPSAVSAGSAQPGAAVLHSQAFPKCALDVRLDGKKVTRVWEGAGPGPLKANAAIDDALQPRRAPAKYRYEVIATVPPGGAKLKSLEIETDVMAAPLSLPRLRLGDNKFVYTDQQAGPHEITITQEWRECGTLKPPLPPTEPEYPAAGATIRDSLVTFKWPATDGARAWHIQVSRRADFRIPYRPSYDVVIRDRQWCVPYTGMFSPDETYYWRVRARDKRGIWSEWSPAWTFRWEGPRVPLDVRIEPHEEGMMLRWGPNPRGTRPVAYDVYGSDEKGFSVHKAAYVSYARGTVPANFLGRTADTSRLVISPTPTHANMNKCYYRVVAVDAGGAESICSDFAETPHPHFWSRPAVTARVGAPFSYQPGVIRSLGDAQHRYEPQGNGFWDREEPTFSLRKAPAWLKLDMKTGTLAGTPDAPGKHPIELEVRTQFGGSAVQPFALDVAPASAPTAVYHVAPDGDDARDGLAPQQAWRTLERVNTAKLAPGDRVLFRRGGTWRGQLQAQSGRESAPITYGAHGEGLKPALLGSVAMDRTDDWKPAGPNLWTTAASELLTRDVGNIIFDHGTAWGLKRWKVEDLRADGDYWYDRQRHLVVLYLKEHPTRRFKSIELALNKHIIDQGGRAHVVYENLALRYGAAHGVGGGSTHHIIVRDCDISWIGGGHQFTRPGGQPVRFGNGIEFWGSAQDCLVERCRVWEVYDAALTNQNLGAAAREARIVYRHNVIWNCEYSFEYWNNPETSRTEQVSFEHNTCYGAGFGWGHAQRPDRNGRHLCFYGSTAQTRGLSIRDNIFCQATDVSFDALWWKPEVMSDRQVISLDRNCWFQPRGTLVRLKGKSYTQAEFAAYQREIGQDLQSLAADPQLVDPGKLDFRLKPTSPCPGRGANLDRK